jgi:quinol monooxygenase YgiN
MDARQLLVLGASMLASCLGGPAMAAETQDQYVRIAELEIDPGQLAAFQAAIKESVETSVRVEPGVLVLYAVSEKDDPARIRVFEIYTDADAYRTHLETPHFRKFRAVTETMVRSRKLLDAIPIAMGAKGR